MRKCKRNIILIFGYFLFGAILFIPCQKFYFGFDIKNTEIRKVRTKGKFQVAFTPIIISRTFKYGEYRSWESKKIIVTSDRLKELNKEKNEKSNKARKTGNLDNMVESALAEYALEEFIDDLKEEFQIEFGEKSHYYSIRTEFFITEISIILFTAGFAYILFCVVWRKEKREKE